MDLYFPLGFGRRLWRVKHAPQFTHQGTRLMLVRSTGIRNKRNDRSNGPGQSQMGSSVRCDDRVAFDFNIWKELP